MNRLVASSIAYEYAQQCTAEGLTPCEEFQKSLLEDGGRCVITPASLDSDPSRALRSLEIVLEYLPRTPITEFALAGFSLEERAFVKVAEAVGSAGQLIAFSMAACLTPGDRPGATEAVAAALGKCTHLQRMGIIECGLSDAALRALCAKSVLHPGASLRRLVLASNALGPDGIAALVDAVVKGGDGSIVRLADLDVSHNAIGDAGAASLGALLTEGTPVRLEALQAEACGVGPEGVAALLRSVSKSSRMRFLDLSGNRLGEAGALAVAALVRTGTPQLEELRLCGGGMADAALAALLRATASHPGLKLLDASGSPMGHESLQAACHMIKSNATLRGLKLETTSADQSSDLSAAVKINPSLVDLEVLGPRTDAAVAAIAMQLRANRRYAGAGRDADFAGAAATPDGRPAGPPSASAAGSGGPRLRRRSGPGSVGHDAASSPGVRPRPQESPSLAAYSGLSRSASMVSRAESLRPELRTGLSRRRLLAGDDEEGSVALGSTPEGGLLGKDAMPTLVGGGASHIAAQTFHEVDKGVKGYLDSKDMLRALIKLGVLDGYTKREMEAISRNEFRVADASGIGRVSLTDFRRYYNQLLHSRARELRHERLQEANLVTYPPGYAKHEGMRTVFGDFAAFGAGHGRSRVRAAGLLERGQWAKLCRDARFVAPFGPLAGGTVEVLFERAKPTRDAKGLGFKDFLRALAMVAQEGGVPFEEVAEALGVEPLPVDVAWRGAHRMSRAESVVSGVSGVGSQVSGSGSLAEGALRRRVASIKAVSSAVKVDLPSPPSAGAPTAPSEAGSATGSALLRKRASMNGGGFFKAFYAHHKDIDTAAAAEAHAEMADAGVGLHRASVDGYLRTIAVQGGGAGSEAAASQGRLSAGGGSSDVGARHARPLRAASSVSAASASAVGGRGAGDAAAARNGPASAVDARAQTLGTPPRHRPPPSQGSRELERRPSAEDMTRGLHLAKTLEARVAYLEQRLAEAEGRKGAKGGGAVAGGVDRLDRVEAALLQIATRVDEIETRLQSDHQDTLKALEAVLAASRALAKPSPAGRG